MSRSACRAAYQPGMPGDPGPGRSRRRREVDAAQRGAPRRRRDDRTTDRLHEREGPAQDVAADVGRIERRSLGRGHRVRREDAVAEARREPLDLPGDELGRVERRVRRHVQVRPQHLPALGRPGAVEHGRLHGEHVRAVASTVAARDRVLAGLDLGARAAEVHGGGARDVGIAPTGSARRGRSRPWRRPVRSGSGGSRARTTPAGRDA